MSDGTSFPADERRYLLGRPGIGPGVLARLEACGYASLAQLRAAGVDAVLEAITRTLGPDRWSNRRRALTRALQDA